MGDYRPPEREGAWARARCMLGRRLPSISHVPAAGWGRGGSRREGWGSLGRGSSHGGDRGPGHGSNHRPRNSRGTREAEVLFPSGFDES